MPETTELIGYAAAVITSVAYVPQALMVWRNDDTRSISLGMYSLMVFGIGIWLLYGILLNNHPLIAANIFMILVTSSILYKKIMHLRAGSD